VDYHAKFSTLLHFTYLIRSVTTSCELFFAFRYLNSRLTLTRAVSLMSSHVLNTVYRQNPGRSSLTVVGDGCVLVCFRLVSCVSPCCRGVGPGKI